MSGQGSLFLVAFAIVADAEEVLLEAAMTAGSNMTWDVAQLTRELNATRRAAGTRTTTPGRGERGCGRRLGAVLPAAVDLKGFPFPRVAALAAMKLGLVLRDLMRCSVARRRA